MESLDQCQRLEVREKASSSSFFFDFALIFLEFNNLIKQLIYSGLLDMRLVIANLALRASLVIYHLISNARSWNNCYIYIYIYIYTVNICI